MRNEVILWLDMFSTIERVSHRYNVNDITDINLNAKQYCLMYVLDYDEVALINEILWVSEATAVILLFQPSANKVRKGFLLSSMFVRRADARVGGRAGGRAA